MVDFVHIVYATDCGYFMPTMVSAASAVAKSRHPDRIVVHILDCGILDSMWEKFSNCVSRLGCANLLRHKIDMRRYNGYAKYRGGVGNYARFEIPELLDNVSWCVYADGDTLFLDDISELAKLSNDSFLLLGHRDIPNDLNKQLLYQKYGYKGDVSKDCVCSGFLLMNLKQMRECKSAEKMTDFLMAHADEPIYDQDVINIICEGRIGYLPFAWGAFNIEAFKDGETPKCMHYAFGKPWKLEVCWTHCLLDVDRLWFRAAKKYCGIGITEAGATRKQFWRRMMRSLFHRLFLSVVCCFESGRQRWGRQRRYYSPVALSKLV